MRFQRTGLPPLTGEVAKPKVLTEGFTPLRKEKYEMKRFLSLLLAAVLLLALAACGGNVKDVQTKAVASEMYTQNDIDAAIDVIKKDFSRSWKGCTLTEISYAGDDVSREHQDWADRNNADEVLVLTSTLDVDESGASPSLNPGQTYTRWMWILVRTNGGTWQHVDHGY